MTPEAVQPGYCLWVGYRPCVLDAADGRTTGYTLASIAVGKAIMNWAYQTGVQIKQIGPSKRN